MTGQSATLPSPRPHSPLSPAPRAAWLSWLWGAKHQAWLDTLLFVLAAGLMGSGFLLHWRLPHGSAGARGGGLTVWGLNRHDWGELHFWLALAMVLLVLLHLVKHWRWVVAVAGGHGQPVTVRRRLWLSALALAMVLALALAPLATPPTVTLPVNDHRGLSHAPDDPNAPPAPAGGVAPRDGRGRGLGSGLGPRAGRGVKTTTDTPEPAVK